MFQGAHDGLSLRAHGHVSTLQINAWGSTSTYQRYRQAGTYLERALKSIKVRAPRVPNNPCPFAAIHVTANFGDTTLHPVETPCCDCCPLGPLTRQENEPHLGEGAAVERMLAAIGQEKGTRSLTQWFNDCVVGSKNVAVDDS